MVGYEDQYCYLYVVYVDVDYGELVEGGGVDVEYFVYCQYVGVVIDLVVGQCGYVGLGIVGNGGWMDLFYYQKGYYCIEYDVEGCVQVYCDEFWVELQNVFDVYCQGQQYQCGGQQDIMGDWVVQVCVLVVDQFDGVVDVGDQIVQQQSWYDGVEVFLQFVWL